MRNSLQKLIFVSALLIGLLKIQNSKSETKSLEKKLPRVFLQSGVTQNSRNDIHHNIVSSFDMHSVPFPYAAFEPSIFSIMETLPKFLTNSITQVFNSIFRVKSNGNNNSLKNSSYIGKKVPFNSSLTKIKVSPVESYNVDEVFYGESEDNNTFFVNAVHENLLNGMLENNITVTNGYSTTINNNRDEYPNQMQQRVTSHEADVLSPSSASFTATADAVNYVKSSPIYAGYFTHGQTFSLLINNASFANILNSAYNLYFANNEDQYTKYIPLDTFPNGIFNADSYDQNLLSYIRINNNNELQSENTFGYIAKNESFGYFGNDNVGYFAAYPYGYLPNGSYGFFPDKGMTIRNATNNDFTNAIYFDFPNRTTAFYIPFALDLSSEDFTNSVLDPNTSGGAKNEQTPQQNVISPLDPLKFVLSTFFNITKIENLVKSATPPIGSTLGVNQVTESFRAFIPPSERQGIINSFQEKEVLEQKANDIVQQILSFKDRAINGAIDYSSKNQRIDPFIKDYNTIANWNKNLPFFAYDEFRDAFLDYASLYLKIKQNATEARDEIYSALLDKEHQFYNIPGKPINNVRQNLQYAMNKKYENLMPALAPIGDFLTTWRDNVDTLQFISSTNLASAQICALNPICCEHPLACPPNYHQTV